MAVKFPTLVRTFTIIAILASSSAVSGKPAERPLLIRDTTAASVEVCSAAFDRNKLKINALARNGNMQSIVALMQGDGCTKVAADSAAKPAGSENPVPLDFWIVCRLRFRYGCIFGTGEIPKAYLE